MNHIYINIFEEKIKYYIDEFETNKRIKIKENEIIIPLSFSTGEVTVLFWTLRACAVNPTL